MAFMAEEMIKLNPDVLFCIIGDGVEKDKVHLLAKELGIINNSLHQINGMIFEAYLLKKTNFTSTIKISFFQKLKKIK